MTRDTTPRTLTNTPLLVPVVRAADDAKPGPGRITISSEDPTLVIGYGTSFSKLAPKMQLMFSKATGFALAEVSEVISDTEVRVKKEFSIEGAKKTPKIIEKLLEAKANGVDGLDYKILPHIDQGVMYKDVYHRLTEGSSIAIFPEGRWLDASQIKEDPLTCDI